MALLLLDIVAILFKPNFRGINQMSMYEKLQELIQQNSDCKAMFGFGQDVVNASFQEPDVVEHFKKNMEMIHHNAGAILNHFTKRIGEESKFDCRSGCSFCCHMRVAVSALEIFIIARFVRENYEESEVEELKIRLEKNLKRLSSKSSIEHSSLKMPCALLDKKGQCSIYEARPFSCRRWLSYDVSACEAAFKTSSGQGEVPLEARIFAIGVGIEDALLRQFAAKGLDCNYYELHSGLLCALQNEDAEGKWCQGEEVFQNCVLSE